MDIVLDVQISGSFNDACLVDGYKTTTELIHTLKKNFNDENQVIDLFNYLDSDGSGTRCPTKLELIPHIDFADSKGKHFDLKSIKDLKEYASLPNIAYFAWRNGKWRKWNKFSQTWREIT